MSRSRSFGSSSGRTGDGSGGPIPAGGPDSSFAAVIRAAAVLLSLGMVAAGCAPADRLHSGPGAWIGRAGPDTIVGTVREVGNTPFSRTVLVNERGSVGVTGPYEEEIRRLVGARVRATGRLEEGAPFGPALSASGFEILSVDGDVPVVGVLGRDERGFFLAPDTGKAPGLRLESVPADFPALLGARVWLVVDSVGTVLRYGVLRDPQG